MAAQIGETAGIVEPRGLLQLVEHGDKPLGRKPRLPGNTKAHAIGLSLHVAREIKLGLRCNRLPPHNDSVGTLWIFARCQSPENHRPDQPRRLLTLARNQTRNMALGHMAQLMGQDGSQLIPARHNAHQPEMHPKVGSGQGKRIDRPVPPQQQAPRILRIQLGWQLPARSCGCHKRQPNALYVVANDGVVEVVGVAIELAGNAVTQAALGGRGDGDAVT